MSLSHRQAYDAVSSQFPTLGGGFLGCVLSLLLSPYISISTWWEAVASDDKVGGSGGDEVGGNEWWW